MSVLSVAHLTKIFTSGFWPFKKVQSFTAINDLSFQLGEGEILGFLGTNGAGKTTTIQMLLGTLKPTSGAITYFGNDFFKNRIEVLKRIGSASGYDRLPARLTVAENLDIVGRIYGISSTRRKEQIEKLLKFFGIWHLRDRETGPLSAGQATRVILAKAFIADPDIVLLDEPTASLDPEVAYEVRHFILAQRNERNISLLITSHNMHEITELCDRVLVLKQGAIVAEGTPIALAQSISEVRIHLIITNGLERILSYLRDTQRLHTVQDTKVTIELKEYAIAQFFIDCSTHNITYSHVSIDKPTLEDYFLNIARQKGAL